MRARERLSSDEPQALSLDPVAACPYGGGTLTRTGFRILIAGALLPGAASPARAQATGRILGTVSDAVSREPIPAARVFLPNERFQTLTSDRGLFVLAGVPAGEHTVRVERLGYRPVVIEAVAVRAGRATELRIEIQRVAVPVEDLTVEAERGPLMDPDVSATRELVLGRELLELPIDAVEEAIEPTPGVSDGHFRGNRVGQETYAIDGLDIKNPFELAGTGVSGYGGDGRSALLADLNRPEAVAVAPDGRTLFIADVLNHRIRIVNLNTGIIGTLAGTGEDEFNGDLLDAGATSLDQPAGLAISANDRLYLSDTGHHIVRRGAVRFVAAEP